MSTKKKTCIGCTKCSKCGKKKKPPKKKASPFRAIIEGYAVYKYTIV